ncbi:putative terpene synthase, metal-binding domain, isoprenoid synthase domain superfamily [Helianthus anomalus]
MVYRFPELYFWVVGGYIEPQYSRSRIFFTKVITIATILDDTYDCYGTYEELELFNEAIHRWLVSCIDTLTDYMKFMYKIFLDSYGEIEEIMGSEGKVYEVDYAKDLEGVQTLKEEAFKWALSFPPLVKSASLISRIMDDVVGGGGIKGGVSSVECYMKEHDVKEDYVYNLFKERVEDVWKDKNLELLTYKDIHVVFKMRVINLARVIESLESLIATHPKRKGLAVYN